MRIKLWKCIPLFLLIALFALLPMQSSQLTGTQTVEATQVASSAKTYKITYKNLKGAKNSNPSTYTYSTTKALKLKSIKRDGYKFGGWYTDSKFKHKITSIAKKTKGNITLYAKWTAIKYNVTFVGNGATSGSTAKLTKCVYGKSYRLKANGFKHSGYTFAGWNTKADGSGTSYTNKASVKNLRKTAGTVKLYAQWAKSGSNYIYVSPKEKDTNKGTVNSPLKTVQAAIKKAKAGDTIYLRQGTYKGTNKFVRSGTDKKPITITRLNSEKVVLTYTTSKSTEAAVFDLNGKSYITIKRLEIGKVKGQNVYGIILRGGEKYVKITNNNIHNIETTEPDGEGEANGILLFGESTTSISYVDITGNKVHDNINGWSENISVSANCENIKVNNNKVYNNTNIGIDFAGNAGYCSDNSLDHPRNCEAKGNTVYNNKSAYADNAGIYVDGAKNITITENTVYNNRYGIEVGSEIWKDSFTAQYNQVSDITVKNNKIYNNPCGGIRIGGYTAADEVDTETGFMTGVVTKVTITGNTLRTNGSGKEGQNGEICLAKCDHITISKNHLYKKNAEYPMVYCDEDIAAKGGITNITFTGNVYHSPAEDDTWFYYPNEDLDGTIICSSVSAFNALLTNGTESWKAYAR